MQKHGTCKPSKPKELWEPVWVWFGLVATLQSTARPTQVLDQMPGQEKKKARLAQGGASWPLSPSEGPYWHLTSA